MQSFTDCLFCSHRILSLPLTFSLPLFSAPPSLPPSLLRPDSPHTHPLSPFSLSQFEYSDAFSVVSASVLLHFRSFALLPFSDQMFPQLLNCARVARKGN